MWWRDAVLYQIYPRSFADSNGDGIGDLRGITSRLEYLEWLGIDGMWLNPTMPSPNVDWGYDVADYTDVHPALGTLADLDELVAEAGRRGIRVLLDLVPNHTSDRHPWFEESRSSRESPRRGWYLWADGDADRSPPNNWISPFGGRAWTYDEPTRQWYMHNFAPAQPDLDWWSEGVRDAFDEVLRFWFDRGVAGFRIDVANALIKDADLRDNPEPVPDDDPWSRRYGQPAVYNANRPEVHEIYRRWRRIANEYDPQKLFVGETWVWDRERWAEYFGEDDELQLSFDFRVLDAPFDADLSDVVAETQSALQARAAAALAGSNHDVVRFPTRWCGGDDALIRLALLVLLTLPGVPFLYYGDEIGMENAHVPEDRIRDVATPSRDPARTPMQWADESGAGFTKAGVEPWLPFGDLARNVDSQRNDTSSILSFCRHVIALRRTTEDLRAGRYEAIDAPDDVWAWRRGEGTLVAVNFGKDERTVYVRPGTIAISTDRARDGERVEGELRLRGKEGIILAA